MHQFPSDENVGLWSRISSSVPVQTGADVKGILLFYFWTFVLQDISYPKYLCIDSTSAMEFRTNVFLSLSEDFLITCFIYHINGKLQSFLRYWFILASITYKCMLTFWWKNYSIKMVIWGNYFVVYSNSYPISSWKVTENRYLRLHTSNRSCRLYNGHSRIDTPSFSFIESIVH